MSSKVEDVARDSTTSVPPIVAEGLRLYDLGLNVFPIPPGRKEPYGEHSFLDATRLYKPMIPYLIDGSNLVVRMGRLSGNLFSIDCDSFADFEQVGEDIQERRLCPWIRNSVRGGQYWFRCAEGEIANGKWGDTQFLGNGVYCLAPPSVHPSGLVYEWVSCEGDLPPLVPLDLLDFLPLCLKKSQGERGKRGKHTLPSVAHAVLEERDISKYNDDNSRAEFNACLSLLSAGFTDDQIMRLFKTYDPPHYRRVGDINFQRAVLDKAHTWWNRHSDATEARPGSHSSVFLNWATSVPWPGRTGNVDKAIFLGLCERMRMEQGAPFRASCRELAELSGVNKDTVPKALKRLQKARLIRYEGKDKTSGASLYSLHLPADLICSVGNERHTVGKAYASHVGDGVCISFAGHDAWSVRALGKSALNCYTRLLSKPHLTVAELVAATGRTRPTIRGALAKLEQHGLALPNDGSWNAVATTVEKLDEVARTYNTLGKAAWKARRHQTEREIRASLETRCPETGMAEDTELKRQQWQCPSLGDNIAKKAACTIELAVEAGDASVELLEWHAEGTQPD